MTSLVSPSLPVPSARATPSVNATGRFSRHPLARLGGVLLLLLLVGALGAGRFSPAPHKFDALFPNGINSLGVPHAPGRAFPLGADSLGRDVWTRVLFGARLSLAIALCAMLTSTLIGTLVGLIAGFFGGRTDRALTRLTEIVASLPTILLAITLTLVLPDSWRQGALWKPLNLDPRLVLAIGLVTWTGISRAVRGQVLSLREREFVEAARALGASNSTILRRHILPNVLPTVITLATLATASNILLEAGLSYLGLNTPDAPSWGSMIAEGQPYFANAPWITLAPGVAIVLAVIAFNLLGNALSESLETRR
jgi:ABC-type dipeptide/oligopeptide/nickel transport system permease subunit